MKQTVYGQLQRQFIASRPVPLHVVVHPRALPSPQQQFIATIAVEVIRRRGGLGLHDPKAITKAGIEDRHARLESTPVVLDHETQDATKVPQRPWVTLQLSQRVPQGRPRFSIQSQCGLRKG